MRHFSGEFTGLRLLMADELDLIAGGEGEDTDDVPPPPPPDDIDQEIVVNGRRITMTHIDGPAPSTNAPPPPPPVIIILPPDNPDSGGFNLGGDECQTAKSEFNEAIDKLSNGSPTAKMIIDAAKDGFINIDLIKPGSAIDSAQYNNGTKTISWDPFEAYSGANMNGSIYTEVPVMALMHEFVHWANPGLGEAEIMRFTNEIAREMNANTGTHFSTGRDNHTGFAEYAVKDSSSEDWAGLNGRPGC